MKRIRMKKQVRNFEWMKDLFAVLVFLFLFPYFAVSFKEQKDEWLKTKDHSTEVTQSVKTDIKPLVSETTAGMTDGELMDLYELISESPHNKKYFVTWEGDAVSMTLPVEHFLIGGLAASIPVTYEEDTLKAQAIVLRSTLYQAYSETKNSGQKAFCVLTLDETTGNFWTDKKMQTVWGKNYEDYLKKCVKAVVQTQGVYLSYKEKAINGCYHGMSAGKTRSADELSEEGLYSYLKQTDCADNLSASDYMSEQKIEKEKVGKLSDAVVNDDGYVISVRRDEKLVSGEQLRNELGLASSNFTWKEEGDEYIFMSKGRGHGFGLDQYYGNILAKRGRSYQEIIEYFFTDIDYERME